MTIKFSITSGYINLFQLHALQMCQRSCRTYWALRVSSRHASMILETGDGQMERKQVLRLLMIFRNDILTVLPHKGEG